jgi:RND superfamily putative drug exporter
MFERLGRLTASRPWFICACWLVVGVALTLVAPDWDTRAQDDDIRFLPERCPSVRGYQLLQRAFPSEVFASRLVFAVERDEQPLTDADLELVARLVADLEGLRKAAPELSIGKVTSCHDGIIGSRLTSQDRHCTLIQVPLSSPFLALQTQAAVDRASEVLHKRMAAAGSGAPHLYATGSAGVGHDLLRACGDSLEGTTAATILLVVIVLLLVYRAPLLALVPLVTIAVSVWVSLKVLALATLLPGVHLVNISKIFAVVILYGAGTDYCLFLISRYREELHGGSDVSTAVGLGVGHVGGALAASAGTVMIGLGLMGLAEFAKVRYAGPAIALSLGVALAASLTLTPALLRLLGNVVFWPQRPPSPQTPLQFRRHGEEGQGFWNWISRRVVARPILIWSTAVVLLLPLALLGLRVRPNYRPTGELPPDSQSIKGMSVIQKHFTAGETGPLTVLLASPIDWDSTDGRAEVDQLSRGLARLDNVAEVRSLTQPLGKCLPNAPALQVDDSMVGKLFRTVQPGINRMLDQARRSAREHYVAMLPATPDAPPTQVTRLDVVLKTDPFDPASAATLEQVQTWLRDELPRASLLRTKVQAECFGVTANAHDLAEVTESDRLRVNTLILIGILGILLMLLKRAWLAGYLLVTVLFSYYAALGATILAGTLWSGRPLESVDWRVPFFLFTILVAVGEDYNILLLTRVLQERSRYGTREGLRRALARTGGAITSCGLIMAGTFATLMLGGLGTLKQIGFALAFGVLLDTFVVRPFLVPAFILVFWREKKHRAETPDRQSLQALLPRPVRRAG